jgi:hypothetical protein
MFYRELFVTNSSSTSLIAFGISMNYYEFLELEEKHPLPKGVDYCCTPWDTTYVHIGFPSIDIKDGLLKFPAEDSMLEDYQNLKNWLNETGIEDEIGYIEGSWYNG